LIPPVNRPVTQSSSGSSHRSTPTLPTPPSKARQALLRQGSGDSQSRIPSREDQRQPIRQIPGSSHPHPLRQNSNELGDEISQLLGGPLKPVAVAKPAQPVRKPSAEPPVTNAFVADWLSHPNPSISVPQSPRSGSVYIPVNHPKDRPTIPKGGLAPAPPAKVKALPIVASSASGGIANKWADRLRRR